MTGDNGRLFARLESVRTDLSAEDTCILRLVIAMDEYLEELLSEADPAAALRRAGFPAAAGAIEKRRRLSRKHWTKGGRPTVMDADKIAALHARLERGESPTEIAKVLGVSRASVYRHLKDREA